MHYLVIDSGNTSIKTGLFFENQIIQKNSFPIGDEHLLLNFLHKWEISAGIVADVSGRNLFQEIKKNSAFFLIENSPNLKIPFNNLYESPATLGVDRLAAVAGASGLFPKKNILIIDAGTCIKYDFLDAGNNFLGGAIAPGLEMRFKALHNFTGKLPLISSREENFKIIGNTTNSSMMAGVLFGLESEIKGFMDWYAYNFKTLKTIGTGGDSKLFKNNTKIECFPDLILMGLFKILMLNLPPQFENLKI